MHELFLFFLCLFYFGFLNDQLRKLFKSINVLDARFFRTYFKQNWTLDYARLMDTNFEDYGIRLWYQKNKKNEIKNKKQEVTL